MRKKTIVLMAIILITAVYFFVIHMRTTTFGEIVSNSEFNFDDVIEVEIDRFQTSQSNKEDMTVTIKDDDSANEFTKNLLSHSEDMKLREINDTPGVYYILNFIDSSENTLTTYFGKEEIEIFGKRYEFRGENKLVSFIESKELEEFSD